MFYLEGEPAVAQWKGNSSLQVLRGIFRIFPQENSESGTTDRDQ